MLYVHEKRLSHAPEIAQTPAIKYISTQNLSDVDKHLYDNGPFSTDEEDNDEDEEGNDEVESPRVEEGHNDEDEEDDGGNEDAGGVGGDDYDGEEADAEKMNEDAYIQHDEQQIFLEQQILVDNLQNQDSEEFNNVFETTKSLSDIDEILENYNTPQVPIVSAITV